MQQYAFEMTKCGMKHTVFCTAPAERSALIQVLIRYSPEFDVNETPASIREPHRICTEIDASRVPELDNEFLWSEYKKSNQ